MILIEDLPLNQAPELAFVGKAQTRKRHKPKPNVDLKFIRRRNKVEGPGLKEMDKTWIMGPEDELQWDYCLICELISANKQIDLENDRFLMSLWPPDLNCDRLIWCQPRVFEPD